MRSRGRGDLKKFFSRVFFLSQGMRHTHACVCARERVCVFTSLIKLWRRTLNLQPAALEAIREYLPNALEFGFERSVAYPSSP